MLDDENTEVYWSVCLARCTTSSWAILASESMRWSRPLSSHEKQHAMELKGEKEKRGVAWEAWRSDRERGDGTRLLDNVTQECQQYRNLLSPSE